MEYGAASTRDVGHETSQPDWIDRSFWPGPYAVPDFTADIRHNGEVYGGLDKFDPEEIELEKDINLYPGDPLTIDGELVGWVIQCEWRAHRGFHFTVTYQPYLRSTSET